MTDLYLVIGRLSSIVDDSVQFYWDMLSQWYSVRGIKAAFPAHPGRMLCLDCSNAYTPGRRSGSLPGLRQRPGQG